MILSLPDMKQLVAAANAGGAAEQQQLDALFGTSFTLAVYGTLAPGQPNHHLLAPLRGRWTEGVVEGDLVPAGWGATLGYPAFRPREGGAAVPVHVLVSPSLANAWTDLDRFEGPGYQRILVPVFRSGGGQAILPVPSVTRTGRIACPPLTVANLYAATEPFPDGAHR